MKRFTLVVIITFIVSLCYGQIKVHEDNHVSIGTITNGADGVHIYPNKYVWFKKPSIRFGWMQQSLSGHIEAKNFIVAYPGVNDHTFYVYGSGHVYAKSSNLNWGKGVDDVGGIDDPIDQLTGIDGVSYFDTEDAIEGMSAKNDDLIKKYREELQNNEYVNKDAIEDLIADKFKRRYGIDPVKLEKVFPEAVRTTPEGHKTISYSDIVVLCIEAIKELNAKVEKLEKILKESNYDIDNH